MVTNPKSKEDQDDLNKRLRSLKIDRGPAPLLRRQNNRSPKLLLLAIAVAAGCCVRSDTCFSFRAAKPISVDVSAKSKLAAPSAGESVLSASGYVVAHHKIAVGAKVMGRVAWIGVEKGDLVQAGQVLVRLEDS